MSRAVLSLGSNIGDRAANLRGALATLRAAGATVVAVSPVYATAPWGGVEQDEFLNAVVVVESQGTSNYPAGVKFGSRFLPLSDTYQEVSQ